MTNHLDNIFEPLLTFSIGVAFAVSVIFFDVPPTPHARLHTAVVTLRQV